ncbi:hypothetical protein V8C86DRAFT_3141759 [Haematococcus lacustris]
MASRQFTGMTLVGMVLLLAIVAQGRTLKQASASAEAVAQALASGNANAAASAFAQAVASGQGAAAANVTQAN